MGRMDELVNAEDLAPRRARVGVHKLAHSPHPGFFFFLSVILRILTLYLLLFVLTRGGCRGWRTEPAQQGGRKHQTPARLRACQLGADPSSLLTCANGWDSSCVAILFAFI